MLIIDVIIVALAGGMAAWGFSRGITTGTLALAGFGAGAVLGSRLAPLLLEDGLHSTYAPILALPGALIVGGLVAALFERFGFGLQGRLQRLGAADGIGGALVAGCLALVAAWIIGAVVAQVDSLRDPVERSAILKRLNAVLPPPGPVLAADVGRSGPIPTFEGPAPRVRRADPTVARDRQVRAAMGSVVKVITSGCGHGTEGSGWIAGDGVVVTNAHVVAGADAALVQVRGEGPAHAATPIWFDDKNDTALLRSAGVRGLPALPIVRKPKAGTSAATLGFPRGRREIRPARLGAVGELEGRLGGRAQAEGSPVAPFSGRVQPGNSGGPLVDTRGRVLGTVFAKLAGRSSGFAVPNAIVRRALRRAGPQVGTGSCEDASSGHSH